MSSRIMQTRSNVGLILTIEELINTPLNKIVSKLEKFIASIGYKNVDVKKVALISMTTGILKFLFYRNIF